VTNTSSKVRGKVRLDRVNGSMMPATGVESPTRIRELPRSTIREQAAKLRSPGRPIEGRPTRVVAPDRRIVEDRQAPRPWIVEDSRVPSVVRTEEALPRWIAVVDRQAVKACPPNPHREVVVVEVPVVAVALAAAAAVAAEAVAEVVVAAAAVVEDKEERI
jgi:hypothetical protein